MKKNPNSQSALFDPRVLLAFTLCSVGVLLAMLSFAANPPGGMTSLASNSPGDSFFADKHSGPFTGNAAAAAANAPLAPTGPGWSIVTSPNTSATQQNSLNSVACVSASDCWAVGHYRTSSHQQTLIEHWNGTSWAIVASPNNGTMGNVLSGVTCSSASQCWAVGYYIYATGNPLQPTALAPLIEQWNGTSWAIAASPSSSESTLVAVTCASASDCWAIGNYGIDVLIERWNGSSWAIVVSPSFNEQTAVPKAVTCASASECWAVGYYYDSTAAEPPNYAFIERWNGTSWAFVPSANADVLTGVTCASASDCWAVGNIEHWDGTSWANVTSPNTGGGANGVTCASASECWAVGSYVNASGYPQTLILEYAPTIPPLTGVVSRKVHGSAGTFDINLPLTGTRGVECRSGGANGNYKVVFSFVNNVTTCGTASIGSLSGGPGSNQCTVNLTGVANQQYVTVTLKNVLDSQNNTGKVAATMGVLLGDTTGNKSVNSSDVSLTKSKSGQAANSTNFRTDVSLNGTINSSDVSLVKSKSGTALP